MFMVAPVKASPVSQEQDRARQDLNVHLKDFWFACHSLPCSLPKARLQMAEG